MVYPALTYLEEIGHATVETEGTRKLYRLTDLGRSYLEEHREETDALFAQFSRVGERLEHMRRIMRSAQGERRRVGRSGLVQDPDPRAARAQVGGCREVERLDRGARARCGHLEAGRPGDRRQGAAQVIRGRPRQRGRRLTLPPCGRHKTGHPARRSSSIYTRSAADCRNKRRSPQSRASGTAGAPRSCARACRGAWSRSRASRPFAMRLSARIRPRPVPRASARTYRRFISHTSPAAGGAARRTRRAAHRRARRTGTPRERRTSRATIELGLEPLKTQIDTEVGGIFPEQHSRRPRSRPRPPPRLVRPGARSAAGRLLDLGRLQGRARPP